MACLRTHRYLLIIDLHDINVTRNSGNIRKLTRSKVRAYIYTCVYNNFRDTVNLITALCIATLRIIVFNKQRLYRAARAPTNNKIRTENGGTRIIINVSIWSNGTNGYKRREETEHGRDGLLFLLSFRPLVFVFD